MIAGGIGLGAVWGWLSGGAAARVLRPRTTWPALTLATVAAGAAAGGLGRSGRTALAFLATAVAVAVTRLAWERWLRSRGGTA